MLNNEGINLQRRKTNALGRCPCAVGTHGFEGGYQRDSKCGRRAPKPLYNGHACGYNEAKPCSLLLYILIREVQQVTLPVVEVVGLKFLACWTGVAEGVFELAGWA